MKVLIKQQSQAIEQVEKLLLIGQKAAGDRNFEAVIYEKLV